MSNAQVIFEYNGHEIIIQCKTDDKIKDIITNFKIKMQNNDNYYYLYGGIKLEITNQKFSELANNQTKIKILVYKYDEDCSTSSSKIDINSPPTQANNKKSFCQRHKKSILISSIIAGILIFLIIIILIIVLKKSSKKNTNNKIQESSDDVDNNNDSNTDNTENIAISNTPIENTIKPSNINDERCLSYSNQQNYCEKCKDDFDLYGGECIIYTFYIEYDIDNVKMNLYNSEKITGLKAMKIEDKIRGPYSEFLFSKKYRYYFIKYV